MKGSDIYIDEKGRLRTEAAPDYMVIGLYDLAHQETMGLRRASLPDHVDLVGKKLRESSARQK